ncbi:hypothetical protein BCR34DRAFT_231933 [Clohesyomyces aquaticus]|uniref:Uncharacterized protein n=1 Tax=Clohesyomyces aquaticus TaxID=1231657 RepID=A0A1Y1ZXB0_9PLEO|nr:hypothetical protein BCR34DRAFT_231933 [Clohesyomyces aquaticus]
MAGCSNHHDHDASTLRRPATPTKPITSVPHASALAAICDDAVMGFDYSRRPPPSDPHRARPLVGLPVSFRWPLTLHGSLPPAPPPPRESMPWFCAVLCASLSFLTAAPDRPQRALQEGRRCRRARRLSGRFLSAMAHPISSNCIAPLQDWTAHSHTKS